MDPVQALAILSLGAFLMVLITAIFYALTIRPRLLDSVPEASVNRLSVTLHEELADQRAVIDQLTSDLAHHTEVLQSTAARADSGAEWETLTGMLRSQTDAVGSLTGLLNEHSSRLVGLDERLGQTSQQFDTLGAALPGIMTQIELQGEKLDRLDGRVDGEALSRLEARLDALDSRLSALPAVGGDNAALVELIQAQADRLNQIGTWFDTWAARQDQVDTQLAEQARILAELDREMAAQAEVARQMDSRVSEHSTLLSEAATDRRQQAGILQRLVDLIGEVFPVMRELASKPAAAEPVPAAEARIVPAEHIIEPDVETLPDLEEPPVVVDEPAPVIEASVIPAAERVIEPDLEEPPVVIDEEPAAVVEASVVPAEESDAEPAPDEAEAAEPVRARPRRLIDIRGIGRVYAKRLHEAGITSFEQLAAMTPEELRTLINAPKWRQIDAESWIEQARQWAEPREKGDQL